MVNLQVPCLPSDFGNLKKPVDDKPNMDLVPEFIKSIVETVKANKWNVSEQNTANSSGFGQLNINFELFLKLIDLVSFQSYKSENPFEECCTDNPLQVYSSLSPTYGEVLLRTSVCVDISPEIYIFITLLGNKCREMLIQIKEYETIIDDMQSQLTELRNQIEATSIDFDLPDDYFDNDFYIL